MDDIERLTARLVAAEERMDRLDLLLAEATALLKTRTRPTKVSLLNVCALDEGRDSEECHDATVYRYQQGCRGVACVREYRDYYDNYRRNRIKAVDDDSDTVE